MIMHLPKLTLFAGAACCLSRLECIRVDCFQREIRKHILYFTAVDIIGLDLRNRVTGEAPAVGALKVRKLDKHYLRILGPFGWYVSNVQDNVSRCNWLSRRSRPQKILDFQKIFLDCRLSRFDCLYLLSQRLDFVIRCSGLCLREGWRKAKQQEKNHSYQIVPSHSSGISFF